MPRKIETRGRKPKGEIPMSWMRFGECLLAGSTQIAAYRKAFPRWKGSDESCRWMAFRLKQKLYATNWWHELLDRAGLTPERLAEKLKELLEAKSTVFFSKDGYVVDHREVADNKTRVAAVKLALESRKLLVQKSEMDVTGIPTPTSFVGWLRSANENEKVKSDSEEQETDGETSE